MLSPSKHTHTEADSSHRQTDRHDFCFHTHFHFISIQRQGRKKGVLALMGNNRFRLSDMMPNAWFYKLKDMGRSRNRRGTTHSMKKKKQSASAASSPAAATHTQTQPSKPNKQQQAHHQQQYSSRPRKSYYFTRELIPKNDHNSPTATHFPDHDPLTISSKQRAKRRTSTARSSPKLVASSVRAGCNCRATLRPKSDTPPNYSASPSDSSLEDDPEICDTFPPEFRCDRVLPTESFDKMLSRSTSCICELDSDSPNDIVIDVDKKSLAIKESNKLVVFDDISDFDLPPIVTKPAKFSDEIEEIKKKRKPTKEPSRHRRSSEVDANGSFSVKVVGEESISSSTTKGQKGSSVKRYSPHSPGVKLRIHSPRVASRRFHQGNGRRSVSSSSSSTSSSRRSLSDSLAIVKSSFDPQRDFRESMVEMIVENNIRASKDLEDLLACYLQLNSDEYHGLIIKVFKQIWFDLTDVGSK